MKSPKAKSAAPARQRHYSRLWQHLGDQLRQAHGLFCLMTLATGLFFVFTVPPFWGGDEDSHFYRAYGISHGRILEEQRGDKLGGQIPLDVSTLAHIKMADLSNNVLSVPYLERNDRDPAAPYKQYLDAPLDQPTTFDTITAPAAYSPLSYLGALAGLFIARIFDATVGSTITLARVGTLLSYVIVVALALYVLRRSALRWLVFVLAVLPTSVYQASIVSADPLTLAFVLLFFAGIIANGCRLTADGSLILLAWAKPTYFVFAPLYARFIKDKTLRTCLIAALSLACFVTWLILTRNVSDTVGQLTAHPESVNPGRQLDFILHNLPAFLHTLGRSFLVTSDSWAVQLYGQIGGNIVSLPMPILMGSFGLVLAGAFWDAPGTAVGKREMPGRLIATGFIGLSIVSILAIVVLLYLSFTPVGKATIDGVQGRYFIPVIPFLAYGLRRLPISVRMPGYFFPAASAVILAFTCFVYAAAL